MSSLTVPTPAPAQATAAPQPGDLYLFSLNVDHSSSLFDAAAALLSADEHERMSRMRAGATRDEVILARATLRALLGCMMLCPPRAVPLTTSAHGKPQLDDRCTDAAIAFNVTHSHGHVLLAFTHGAGVGVDIERIDPQIEATDIAGQNFAPSEQHVLAAAADSDRAALFTAIWVRKEAVLKAHGAGLLLPLASFAVDPILAAEHAIQLHDAAGLGHRFFLRELSAPAGFAAALACSQPGLELHPCDLLPAFLAQLFAQNAA